MLKRLKHILFTGMLLMVMFCALGGEASAFTYQSVPSNLNLSQFRVTIGGVTLPLEEYPDGAWFDPNKSVMTATEASKYGISHAVDLRGWECVGFARYVYTALYYQYPADATIDTSLAYDHGNSYAYRNVIYEVFGTTTLEGGYSASTLKTLITSSYPGSVMRAGGHSMVIMAIFNEGFVVYDANFESSNTVDLRYYSWDAFVQSQGGRTITALHMPSYYPGYRYSTGVTGGTVDEDYVLDNSTAGIYDVINVSTTLNVRSGPAYSSSIVGKLINGDRVVVRGTYGGWAAIEYDSAVCWVHTDYLSYSDNQTAYPMDKADAGAYLVYNCEKLNVRSGPDTATEKMGTLPAGTVVDVIGTYNGWAAFQYNGKTCWGYMVYLTPYSKEVAVSFDANGGSISYSSKVYKAGNVFGDLPSGTKSDRSLIGWFNGTTQYTTSSLVPDTDTLNLKAKWAIYSFMDVDENRWYAKAVEQGYELGVISTDSLFYPDRASKRGEFVTILSRIYTRQTGETISGYSSAQFTDVGQHRYYASPIGWAYEYGIINGITPSEFWPEEPITREQMATILYRYACMMGKCDVYEGPSYLDSFTDGDKVSRFAKVAVNWAVDTGIITGDPNGAMRPKDSAKRSEMVTIAVRFIEYLQG